MLRIVLEPAKCTGCRTCEAVCSLVNEGEANPAKSRIKVIRTVENQILYPVPVYCLQCEEAFCLNVCPVNAITENGEGVKIVDEEKCIGCKLCEMVCPVGAITVNPDKGVATKCDLCAGLGEPQCVKYCFREAIKLLPSEKVGVVRARAKTGKFLELLRKEA